MVAAKPAPIACIAVEKKSPAPVLPANLVGALTRRMADGDEDSYREFYGLYSHRLFAYLYVITHGNDELARELLQQTMIRVAKYVRAFDDEEIFWKWLANLARSAFIDETRKHNRYLGALKRLWHSLRGETPAFPGSDALSDHLQALPEEDRLLLTKKYLEGLSIRELAEHFKVTEKAIESRLTRARAKIKEILSRQRT
jgi:RNA polymerase sigma-70 factor (ECF subfamily)